MTPEDWKLTRHPPTRDRSLRAFDAADVLALAALDPAARNVAVVNDGFGGLTVPLVAAGASVTVWTDSVLAQQAVEKNLRRNQLSTEGVEFRAGTGAPVDDAAGQPGVDAGVGPVDAVIVKVPKTLALLRQQLIAIREVVGENTRIVGAGMVRHIHTSTVDAFEELIGPTVTSLAAKKARLIHPTLDAKRTVPAVQPIRYRTDAGIEVVSEPNVFSQNKLDIGTRLLLAHLPACGDGATILDLGCGNGVVGATMASQFSDGLVIFTDISRAAVASAQQTWAANHGDRPARFLATDLASGVDDESVDAVVINPPFHDQHVVGDETAKRMFAEATRVVKSGGQVRVVGNRHLGYHRLLTRHLADVETVGSNPKFVVLSSRKP